MKNILVAFYSHSGTTKKAAEHIHAITGGDIYEIKEKDPYPRSYKDVVDQAKQEISKGFKPALKGSLPNIGIYDIIFVGSPNWWGTIAPPLSAFLSSADFTGKTIIPFITHGGGGLNHTVADIKKLAQGAAVLDGFDANSIDRISAWIKTLKITAD